MLKNVNGNCYTYGEVTVYLDGTSLGVSGLTRTRAMLENSSGVSEKYLSTEDFFQRGGVWYVETAAGDFLISGAVEIHVSRADI